MKADEVLVQMLLDAGVKRVYGVSGDSLNPFTDAIRTHNELEWVHVRHEEAGAFAAGGEAHLTDQLAVCAGSCGPGNLHLINGLLVGILLNSYCLPRGASTTRVWAVPLLWRPQIDQVGMDANRNANVTCGIELWLRSA